MSDRPSLSGPRVRLKVALFGFSPQAAAALTEELSEETLSVVSSLEAAESIAARAGGVVFCLGPEVSESLARELLERTAAGSAQTRNLLLAGGAGLGKFQDLLDDERLFYLSAAPPPLPEIAALVRGALADLLAPTAPDAEVGLAAPYEPDTILEIASTLARQQRFDRAIAAFAQRAIDLGGAERARVWIHDPQRETLWAPSQVGLRDARASAAVGLVSFALRSGRTVCLERAGADPRFDPDTDLALPDERFLAIPMSSLADGFRGVVVLSRGAQNPPFSAPERAALTRVAGVAAPILATLAARDRRESELALRHGVMGSELADTFRAEALRRHVGSEHEPPPLPLFTGGWLRGMFWLLLASFLAASLAATFGSIHEYASGRAIVRAQPGRTIQAPPRVTAFIPGRYRPLFHLGMPFQLTLDGFRASPQALSVASISPAMLTPDEACRQLGRASDCFPTGAAGFFIEADLSAPTFEAGGAHLSYYDGMTGEAKVLVRTAKILANLLPGLRGASEAR